MRSAMAFVCFSASVLFLALAWWVAHAIRHPQTPYFDEAYSAIAAKTELVPKGGTLVIGDSIVARNDFPTLCGRAALNAGISWSTSHDWVARAPELVRRARPAIVVLALGNNDVRSDWREDYRKLARLATFAVTPKQPDKAAFIRSLLPTVPVPTQTVDGTHLTADGAREWQRRVNAECRVLRLAK